MPVGRIRYLHVGPMTFGEFLAAADPEASEEAAATDPDRPSADAVGGQ